MESSGVYRGLGVGDWPFEQLRTKDVLTSKFSHDGFLPGKAELDSNGVEFALSLSFSIKQVISNITSSILYIPTSRTDITLQNTTYTSISEQDSVYLYSLLVARTQTYQVTGEFIVNVNKIHDHLGVVIINSVQRAEVVYIDCVEMVVQVYSKVSLQRLGGNPFSAELVSTIRFSRCNLIKVSHRLVSTNNHLSVSVQSVLLTNGSRAEVVLTGYYLSPGELVQVSFEVSAMSFYDQNSTGAALSGENPVVQLWLRTKSVSNVTQGAVLRSKARAPAWIMVPTGPGTPTPQDTDAPDVPIGSQLPCKRNQGKCISFRINSDGQCKSHIVRYLIPYVTSFLAPILKLVHGVLKSQFQKFLSPQPWTDSFFQMSIQNYSNWT